jgi:hypothetical protein
MSTNDPEFDQTPKFTPEQYEAPPRQRGCFFYGCIIAIVLTLLAAIFVGILLFAGYRWLGRMAEEYTATAPEQLPVLEMSAEKRQAVKDRVEAFRKAVQAGTAIEPLVLTSDDLNALIEENPELKGKIYVKVEGDEVKGRVSFPLDKLDMPVVGGLVKGRYLNGEAGLKASLRDGVLIVTLDNFEVNGKKPPDEFMQGMRQQNLANAYKDEKTSEMIRKLESLDIKDGTIILKVRAKPSGVNVSTGEKATPVEVVPPPSKNGQPKADSPKNGEPNTKAAPEPAPAQATPKKA